MSKVFILPTDKKENSLYPVRLKHPKDESECVYYLDSSKPSIYELNVRQNQFNAWFLNESVIKDGNCYIVTPVDPLFLLLPLIHKNTGTYKKLFDIFAENVETDRMELLEHLFTKSSLKCVASIKSFEDDIFLKFDRQCALNWLKLKFEKIKKSLINNGIGKRIFGFKINNFVDSNTAQDKLSNDEYNILAFEILSDYISRELEQELRTILSIPDKNLLPVHATTNKRKQVCDENHGEVRSEQFDAETVLPTESNKRARQDNSKKVKMTRTQAMLSKVDKTGMKSISSYFQKR